jgi:hypothetical protein
MPCLQRQIAFCFSAFIVCLSMSVQARLENQQVLFLGDCSRASTGSLVEGTDIDSDGITDICEQTLAEKFAPVLYHSSDESNFSTNVDSFLTKTELWFQSVPRPHLKRMFTAKPTQAQLVNNNQDDGGSPSHLIRSDGTRSDKKLVTFFLKDVDAESRKGSNDPKEWTTYYHAYANNFGGITIQYWRLYAYNDAVNDHGGDWEGIHVVLDGSLRPHRIALLGHNDVEHKVLADFATEGDHIRIFSEGGGHGTRSEGSGIHAKGCGGFLGDLLCTIDLNRPQTFVRQETWTNGHVRFFDGRQGQTGRLLNLGEKLKPMNGQVFIQYSGLWGSPSEFPASPSYFSFSGYWGPAFNETGMRADKFITAWCADMANPKQGECFPTDTSP